MAGESIAVEVGLDVKIVAEIVIVPEDGASKSVKKMRLFQVFKDFLRFRRYECRWQID